MQIFSSVIGTKCQVVCCIFKQLQRFYVLKKNHFNTYNCYNLYCVYTNVLQIHPSVLLVTVTEARCIRFENEDEAKL